MKYADKPRGLFPVLALCFFCASVWGDLKTELTGELNSDWFQSATRAIREMEYEASFQNRCAIPGSPSAYHFANRAQNLRAYFFQDSMKIIRRTDAKPEWVLSLRIIDNDAPSTITTRKNELIRTRDNISEIFTNDEAGVHQEIVIEKKSNADVFPILSVDLKNDLVAKNKLNALEIKKHNESLLLYSDIRILDKHDNSLSFDWRIEDDAAILYIDAADAAYPVTAKAVIKAPPTAPDEILSIEENFACFGWSVATAGDVNGDGWADVIVGAPYYDNGETSEGAAFVYYGFPSGLSRYPSWKAESNQAWAKMGICVATAGDVNGDGFWDVAVGIPYWNNNYGDENVGKAQVFHGSSSGLSSTADWEKSGAQGDDMLGWSVASAGDVNGDGFSDLIVGVPFGGNNYDNEGAAHVFYGAAEGLSNIPSWSASPVDQTSANFGFSVASAGDVNGDGFSDIIIGCPKYSNDQSQEGAAYVYLGGEEGLPAIFSWRMESNKTASGFGWSVASAGDVNGDGYGDVIIGAMWHKSGTAVEQGRAFMYFGNPLGLSSIPNWQATFPTEDIDAHYGMSVACAGDVNGDGYADVIVGAPHYGNQDKPQMGRAMIYLGSADGPGVEPDWIGAPTKDNPAMNAYYGACVATAGDINGDGFSDVIIGAPYDPQGTHPQLEAQGFAYVYYGGPGRLNDEPDWRNRTNQEGSSMGISVSTAGDVNGDGYADVIVGAPDYDNGEQDEGAVFLWYGSSTGLGVTANWFAEGDQPGAKLGQSVSSAGDVNGDGYDDIIVGAPNATVDLTNEGRAFVWHGSESGLGVFGNPSNADWSVAGGQSDANLGASVASAGDVNGDGYCDVIVGAPGFDSNLLTNNGIAYVFHGAPGGLSTGYSWSAAGDKANALFGWSVACAGDVNRDGFSDVVIGAPFYSPTGNDADLHKGAARAYYGAAGGLNPSAEWMDIGTSRSARFGYCVSTAGDMDGDGFSDMVIGAPGADGGAGAALFYLGGLLGPVSLNGGDFVYNDPDDEGGALGTSVGCAGDIDCSGKTGVIIGSPTSRGGGAEGSLRGKISVIWNYKRGEGYHAWDYNGVPDNGLLGWSVASAGDVNGDGYAEILAGSPGFSQGESGEGATFLFYGNGTKGIPMIPRQLRTDNAAPIALRGKSDEQNQFRISLLARTPFGRSKVRMQIEAKSLSQILTGTSLFTTGLWQDTGISGYTFNQAFTDSVQGGIYHWRGRVKYKPGNIYGLIHSRWITQPWNGWNEMDFRTSGNFSILGNGWIIY